MNLKGGIEPDAPTDVNAQGGKQSKLDYRFDLIDPLPMLELAKVLAHGSAKYGPWNWRKISATEHLNHALVHIYAFMAGDTQDDHLAHAFCRLMMALSVHLTPGYNPRMDPDQDTKPKPGKAAPPGLPPASYFDNAARNLAKARATEGDFSGDYGLFHYYKVARMYVFSRNGVLIAYGQTGEKEPKR